MHTFLYYTRKRMYWPIPGRESE